MMAVIIIINVVYISICFLNTDIRKCGAYFVIYIQVRLEQSVTGLICSYITVLNVNLNALFSFSSNKLIL